MKLAESSLIGELLNSTGIDPGSIKFSKEEYFLYLNSIILSVGFDSNSAKFIAKVRGGNSSLSI